MKYEEFKKLKFNQKNNGYSKLLVGKIKGIALQIKKYKNLWPLKYQARHHCLAWAFLRHRPYKSLEKKCDVLPNKKLLIEIISVSCYYFPFPRQQKELENFVEEWLNEQ